ncbi:unnamed protein product [Urochloa humidicola]
MAAGCMTRTCALAIATAACLGLPAALVYAIVRVAAARRFGATFALAIVLVFWVTISLAYYPRVCADIVPWSALLRRLRGCRRQRGDGAVPVVAPLPTLLPPPFVPDDRTLAPHEPRRRNGAGGLMLPLFVARGQASGYGGGIAMAALPREPPAGHGGARAGDGGGEPCKRCCAVCLCDVDEIETAAWLPKCLHMFHKQCIEQWLHKHGHSTCPICRSDAFAAPPPMLVQQRAV